MKFEDDHDESVDLVETVLMDGEPRSLEQVSEEAGLPEVVVEDAVRELRRDGRVERSEDGVLELT